MRTHRHTLLFTMLTVALSSTVVSAEEKAPKEVGTTRVVVAALKDDRVAEEAATSLVQVTSETMERIGATNLSNALRTIGLILYSPVGNSNINLMKFSTYDLELS